jgi:lipoate-protein ligase A
MKCLDLSLPSPAENLACDEALLEWCESGTDTELLRFWEPSSLFVVLGYGNRHLQETHASICQRDNVQILRRCSGGGTVLQGPGSLNYSLVLRVDHDPALASITGANRFIMDRNARALTGLVNQKVRVQGFTDLTLENLKFSGNAQRRRKRCLLFHGTFLLDFDIDQIATYLQMPIRQPDYRKERPHVEFLTTVNLNVNQVKRALVEEWNARAPLKQWPREETIKLVLEKYGRSEWNLKM